MNNLKTVSHQLGQCMRTRRSPNKDIEVICCMLIKIIFFSAMLAFSAKNELSAYSYVKYDAITENFERQMLFV